MTSGIGSWNGMLGFVEALYLSNLHDEAAALASLVEGVLELGKKWITFDGRLVETRAGIAAAAARRWEAAERYFGMAREAAEQMSNRLELADLGRLHARMLMERGDTGDYPRAAEMLEKAVAAYRDFGMPAYAAEAERLRTRALA